MFLLLRNFPSKLPPQAAEVEFKLVNALRVLRTDRNKEQKINQLPPECLATIFDILCSDFHSYKLHPEFYHFEPPYFPALFVSQVCGYWRTIALTYRRLWSFISIDHFSPSSVIRLYIERSGDSLFNITRNDTESDLSSSQSKLLREISPHFSSRLRFLDIGGERNALKIFPALFQQPLSNLRCISIQRIRSRDRAHGVLNLPFSEAPKLSHLSISGWISFPVAKLQNLTCIDLCTNLEGQGVSQASFLQIMELNPKLEVLTLQRWTFTEPSSRRSVPAQCLRHLWLHHCGEASVAFILRSLKFSDTISISVIHNIPRNDTPNQSDLDEVLNIVETLSVTRLGLFSAYVDDSSESEAHFVFANQASVLVFQFNFSISGFSPYLAVWLRHIVSLPSLHNIQELYFGLTMTGSSSFLAARLKEWFFSLPNLNKLAVLPFDQKDGTIPEELGGLVVENGVVGWPHLSEVKIFRFPAELFGYLATDPPRYDLDGPPSWWEGFIMVIKDRESRGYPLSRITVDEDLKPPDDLSTLHLITVPIECFDWYSNTAILMPLPPYRINFYHARWETRWLTIPHPFFNSL